MFSPFPFSLSLSLSHFLDLAAFKVGESLEIPGCLAFFYDILENGYPGSCFTMWLRGRWYVSRERCYAVAMIE